jgi:predicted nucleic acid-binding Zn finger protein
MNNSVSTKNKSRKPESPEISEPLSPFSVKLYHIYLNDEEAKVISSGVQSFGIERWIVVGTEQEYLVSDMFCSCQAFLREKKKKNDLCKHIRLFLASKALQEYDQFLVSYDEYQYLRKNWFRKLN